jgi:hypothetical protein
MEWVGLGEVEHARLGFAIDLSIATTDAAANPARRESRKI